MNFRMEQHGICMWSLSRPVERSTKSNAEGFGLRNNKLERQ